MNVRRIHHVTMAVADVEAARETFAALFGAGPGPVDTQLAFGVRSTELALGEDRLQVVAPLGEDSAVQRYLERRGEGFYTLALEVDDVDAAVRELHARGIRVSEPVVTDAGLRTAFVTMAATHGLSIQLVQPEDPRTGRTAIVPPSTAAAAPDFSSEPGAPAQPYSSPKPAALAPPDFSRPPAPGPDAPPPESTPAPLDLTPDEWSDVD